MKVDFSENFPAESKPSVRADIERLAPFISFLIDELNVSYDEEGDGEASIQVLRHYHTANLSLNAAFFSEQRDDRLRILAHEVAHVLLDPLHREASHICQQFLSDEVYEYAVWKVEDALEESVDCLALGLLKAIERRDGDS